MSEAGWRGRRAAGEGRGEKVGRWAEERASLPSASPSTLRRKAGSARRASSAAISAYASRLFAASWRDETLSTAAPLSALLSRR